MKEGQERGCALGHPPKAQSLGQNKGAWEGGEDRDLAWTWPFARTVCVLIPGCGMLTLKRRVGLRESLGPCELRLPRVPRTQAPGRVPSVGPPRDNLTLYVFHYKADAGDGFYLPPSCVGNHTGRDEIVHRLLGSASSRLPSALSQPTSRRLLGGGKYLSNAISPSFCLRSALLCWFLCLRHSCPIALNI